MGTVMTVLRHSLLSVARSSQTAGVRGKVKALGYGGAETSYTVQGERSQVRVPEGTPIAIIVKLENHDVDPANLVDLYAARS